MRNRRNKRKSPKRDKILKVLGILSAIMCIVLFSVIFSIANISNNKIIRGVEIEGINVSAMTQEDANNKIRKWYEDVACKTITLNYKELEENVSIKELGAEENINNAIEKAMKVGRSGNILRDNYEIILTRVFHKKIYIDINLDDEKVDRKVDEISNKLPDSVIQSSYYIENSDLIIKMGQAGTVAEKELLKEMIIAKIKEEDKQIDIPVKYIEADKIDIERIYQEIYKEAQNAYIEEDTNKLHPHISGIDFAIGKEEVNKILSDQKDEYIIPLKITEPEITTIKLGAKAFPDLIAEYTTRYTATDESRSTNIMLSSEKINETIVMPGEVFSYNKIVGERTIAKGYKEAPIYSGGKVVQGIGGGICQVSSTLYNAVLYANLDITSRSNHRFLPSYVKEGRDATVSWGTLDFCFKNTRTYPIKLSSHAANGILKIEIYGIREDEEYNIELETKVLEEKEYKTTIVNDNTVEEGTNIIRQYGSNGIKCETYKIVKLKGKEISRTLISTDTYSPLEEVIRKGTKKVTSQEKKIEETEIKEEQNGNNKQEETNNNEKPGSILDGDNLNN